MVKRLIPGTTNRYCHTVNCKQHPELWANDKGFAPLYAQVQQRVEVQQPAHRGLFEAAPRESAAQVLAGIPKSNRVKMSAEQLDEVFTVMQDFGVFADDPHGFRAFIAKRDQHHEYSERGFGSRYYQSLGHDGTVRDVNLYPIDSSYGNRAAYYQGQAKLRKIFGLPEYEDNEIVDIAKSHWEANILPTLGDIPADGAQFLRGRYIQEIQHQPRLVPEVLQEWRKQPDHRIPDNDAAASTYIETVLPESKTREKLLQAIARGSKRSFMNALREPAYHALTHNSGLALERWARRNFKKA
jgi:hypothetical protein